MEFKQELVEVVSQFPDTEFDDLPEVWQRALVSAYIAQNTDGSFADALSDWSDEIKSYTLKSLDEGLTFSLGASIEKFMIHSFKNRINEAMQNSDKSELH